MEDMYHVFIKCGRFKALRGEVRGLIVKRVQKQVEEYKLEESHVMGLVKQLSYSFMTQILYGCYITLYII
jgi:hypothetical protein